MRADKENQSLVNVRDGNVKALAIAIEKKNRKDR